MRNSPYHQITSFSAGVVAGDIKYVDRMSRAELSISQDSKNLYDYVKKFSNSFRPLYCCRRMGNFQLHFGIPLADSILRHLFTICKIKMRADKKAQEQKKVVHQNCSLTKTHCCHYNLGASRIPKDHWPT